MNESRTLSHLADRLVPRPQTVVNGDVGGCPVPPTLPDALASFRFGDLPPAPVIVERDDSLPREGYGLSISGDAVVIRAADAPGILYAVQTIRQLLIFGGEARSLPAGTIEDAPRLAVRGLMIDVSRNRVPTRETLLHYLDLMLLLKLNHFQLYTEHTFAYRDYRDVWDHSSPFTAEEIRWLDDEARRRNIELVPNQNSFGHLNRWLSLPRLSHLAESPEGFTAPWGQRFDYPFSLSPVVPETRDFLAALYDELLPHFSSTLFNVGCDETFDLGQGRSADACRRRGVGRVYIDFLKEIHRLVTERSHRMIFYADILKNHPELIAEVPKDAIAVEWWYEGENDFDGNCRRLSETGLDFLVAPGTSSWNSIVGRYDNAVRNVRAAITGAVTYGALGILMTDWGDNGHLQSFPVALPPVVLAAGLAWGREISDDEPFRFLASVPGGLGDSGSAEALKILGKLGSRRELMAHNTNLFGISLVNFVVDEYFNGMVTGSFEDDELRDALESARRALGDEPREAGERQLVHREIALTIDMAHFALDLVPLHRNVRRKCPGAGTEARAALGQRERELEERFRAQWHRRFRPGGLEESVLSLTSALRFLDGKEALY